MAAPSLNESEQRFLRGLLRRKVRFIVVGRISSMSGFSRVSTAPEKTLQPHQRFPRTRNPDSSIVSLARASATDKHKSARKGFVITD